MLLALQVTYSWSGLVVEAAGAPASKQPLERWAAGEAAAKQPLERWTGS